jgi:hypothetical protein
MTGPTDLWPKPTNNTWMTAMTKNLMFIFKWSEQVSLRKSNFIGVILLRSPTRRQGIIVASVKIASFELSPDRTSTGYGQYPISIGSKIQNSLIASDHFTSTNPAQELKFDIKFESENT